MNLHRFSSLALLVLAPLAAMAQPPSLENCRAYADGQVRLAKQADAKACPQFVARRSTYEQHLKWCMAAKDAKQVTEAQETWEAKFDGCMSAVEAARTEKALATAERKAKADAVVGSYPQRWAKGVRRMADLGMTRPFDAKGFEFDAVSTQPKRWGAGLVKNEQLGFYAVCDTCQGLSMRLLDPTGKVIEQAKSKANAVDMIAYPMVSGKGSIEFLVTNCQTKADLCKVRYTSFKQ